MASKSISHLNNTIVRSVMVIVLLIALGASVRAQTPLIVTQPSAPVTLDEDLDYMTQAWRDAWDMNEETDIYLFASPTCDGVPPMFSNNSFSNGVWSSSFAVANPYFWLLQPGYPSALHVGKDGNVHLIDADTYTQLTLRMYLSPGFDPSKTPGAVLTWTTGDVSSLSNPNKYGKPYFFKVFPGWNIYTIDLAQSTLQVGNLPWRGKISGLQLSPAFLPAGTNVKIDWVRLTPKPTRTVAWSGSWQSSASANLLFSTDGSTYDPLMIYTDNQVAPDCAVLAPDVVPAGSNGTSGSYNVPASFPPGPVYTKVQIEGTLSAPAGPWQFNAKPCVTITAPSYTSGEEFSASTVGNSWDMSCAPDIAAYDDLTSAPAYANGCAIATNTRVSTNCGRPWGGAELHLNMNGKSVDTSRYRYFTAKIKVNAPFDFGNGWVSRLIWVQNDYNTHGVSNDMPLYTGWNTFHVDLWGDVQDDVSPGNASWQSTSPTLLRFDPTEIPPSTQFEIDYIKLTAADQADFTYDIRWEVHDPDSEDISLNIYYSSTAQSATDALTGDKTLIAKIQPNDQVIYSPKSSPMPDSSGQTGDYMVYLPMVNRNYIELPPCEDDCFRWDTSSVSEGAYYIHIEADDGCNMTHWRSEAPVVIKH